MLLLGQGRGRESHEECDSHWSPRTILGSSTATGRSSWKPKGAGEGRAHRAAARIASTSNAAASAAGTGTRIVFLYHGRGASNASASRIAADGSGAFHWANNRSSS